MANASEKYNWLLIEDFLKNLNQNFKHIPQSSHSIEDSTEISDSTSIVPSEIIASSLETSFYSLIEPEYEELIDYLSIYDQSTRFFMSGKTSIDLQSIEEYKKQFSDTLLQLIHEEIFEYGMENAADKFVQKSLLNNPELTKICLNTILLEHFVDVEVATGLLRIISHLNYTDIYPTGPTMALSVLNHEDAEIRECGIRAFENWGNADSLDYLKHIKCKEKWLQDYLEQVIIELEECYVSSS